MVNGQLSVNNYQLSIKKYPAYKDSGVEWLGEIPAHWATVKMKYLFHDVSIKNRQDETLLSVTQSQGVVPRDWVETRMVMPSGNLESFKFIQKGDFAISLRSFEGGLEYCHHDGIISPAYTVLKINQNLVDFYYKHLFKSFAFISEIQTSVIGIREGKNISYPELSYSLIPVPPAPEQTAIATFLDEKTAKIDTAIAQKEKLIALLEERKQIIIQAMVSGQWLIVNDEHGKPAIAKQNGNGQFTLNNVPLPIKTKDSGVEWLGEIPAGWEVKKLKHFCFITKLTGFEYTNKWRTSTAGEIIALRGHNVLNGKLSTIEAEKISRKLSSELIRSKLCKNDIVYPCTGTIGNAAIIEEDDKYHINQNIARISPNENVIYPYFLLHTLLSKATKMQIHFNNASQMQPVILIGDLRNIEISLPPLTEQKAIVAHIERQSAKTEQAIRLQQAQIEKLKEYKTILINQAVTGKIMVG